MAICYGVMFYHTSNMYTTDKKFLINKVLESNENYLSGCWDTIFNLHNFVQKPNFAFLGHNMWYLASMMKQFMLLW